MNIFWYIIYNIGLLGFLINVNDNPACEIVNDYREKEVAIDPKTHASKKAKIAKIAKIAIIAKIVEDWQPMVASERLNSWFVFTTIVFRNSLTIG